MSEHEQIGEVTQELEDSLYGALDAIDRYREVVQGLLDAHLASENPNHQLVSRYRQFLGRTAAMTTHMEDAVLTDFLFLRHRLFAVDLAERGEFI